MRAAILALVLTCATTSDTQAGAWLREAGAGFASASVSANNNQDTRSQFYGEYGLSERITLGLDVDYGFEVTGRDEGTGTVFLRFPLGPTDRTHKFAWHVGLGARYQNLEFYPAAEVGLSWGRSLKVGERWGWANIDTRLNTSQSPIDTRLKLDGTIGLTVNPYVKVMAQVFNTFQGGDTFVSIAPSVLFTLPESKTTLQFSAEIPAVGGGETFFKLGLWRDF